MAVGELTPTAAGDEDVEQRIDPLTKGGMRHAPTPRRGRWRQQIGQEFPLQVASSFEGSSHGALLTQLRAR
jgi:hypothetical protein